MPNTSLGGTRNDLSESLPALQNAEAKLYDYAVNTLGVDYRVADFGAVRTEADTNQILQYRTNDYNAAVRAGEIPANTPLQVFRRIAPYGSSFHNYGAAFDVLIIDQGPYASKDAALHALKAAASSFGLSSDVPNDPPHFELNTSINNARAAWIDYTSGGSGNISVRVSGGVADTAALVTVAVLGAVLFALRYFRR